MDFSKSVIMPREDFEELQIAAWSQIPTPAGERVAGIIHTSTVLGVIGVVFSVCTWTWYKAAEKLEQKKHENKIAEIDLEAEKIPYTK